MSTSGDLAMLVSPSVSAVYSGRFCSKSGLDSCFMNPAALQHKVICAAGLPCQFSCDVRATLISGLFSYIAHL